MVSPHSTLKKKLQEEMKKSIFLKIDYDYFLRKLDKKIKTINLKNKNSRLENQKFSFPSIYHLIVQLISL